MDINGNSKRRADGTEDRTDNKKCRTTPRSQHSTRNAPDPKMNQSSGSPMGTSPANETRRLFDDLKSHFDRTSQSTADRFESLIGAVSGRVSDNAAAITELRETVKRIENGMSTHNRDVDVRLTRTITKGSPEYRRDRYEAARKMLRLWPVRGREEEELKVEALRFIRQKLQVCQTAVNDDQILKVRRTRQAKKSNVNNEVLVFFADKYARDQVVANAKFLSQYRLQCGKPSAGLRMNYPDHLSADFRVLDWYGAELNRRFPGTKRNIRFDDDTEGLRMDVKVPHNNDWLKIHPQMARDIKLQRTDEDATRVRHVLETPPLYTPGTPSSNNLLTGGNSVTKAPVLSNSALMHAANKQVIHDPDEVIYISPAKRT